MTQPSQPATDSSTPIPWYYKPTTLGHPDNRINPIITTGFDGIDQAHYVARIGWAGSTIPGMTSLTPATFEEAEANAQFIVRAVNNHAKLLKLLELRVAMDERPTHFDLEAPQLWDIDARTAITEAQS